MPRQRKPPWVVDFLRDLHQGKSLSELLQGVLRHALSLVPAAQKGSVLVLDERAGVFRFAVAEGWDMDVLSRIAIPCDRLLQSDLPRDRPSIIRDPLSRNVEFLGEELAAAISSLGPVAAILSAPVTDGTQLVAVVNLDCLDDPDAFSARDLRRLGAAWEEIALAVIAARSRAENIERERLFRSLFERLADAALIMAPDTTILDANPAAERETGYTRDELRGMNVARDLLASPLALTPEGLAERLEREGFLKAEVEKRRKDGTTVWVECSVVAVEYHGAPALLSVGREITDRKRLEEERDARLTALESLARAAPGITGSRDPREVVARIVAAAREIAGADHANVLLFDRAGELAETFDPYGAPKIPVQIRGRGFSRWVLDTGRTLVIDDIRPDGQTTPTVLQDGITIPASASLVREGIRSLVGIPVSVGGTRRAVLYVHSRQPGALARHAPVLALLATEAGVALENALLYQELQESEARYRTLFEESPVPLLIVDLSAVKKRLDELRAAGVDDITAYAQAEPAFVREVVGLLRVVGVNRAALELYRVGDREEFMNLLPNFVTDESRALFLQELRALWTGQTAFSGTGSSRTAGGGMVHVRFGWRCLPGYERSYGRVLISALDITGTVVAEREARQAGQVLAAVASVAELFLRTEAFDQAAGEALAELGTATGASRVYVFQEREDGAGRHLVSQKYEWVAPGIVPQIANPDLQDLPYAEVGFRRWREAFLRGKAICGLVREFPAEERALLGAQGILSIAVVPVFAQGVLWGFLGFDDCVGERCWTDVEIEALRAAAEAFGAAVYREGLKKGIEARQAQLEGLFQVAVAVGKSLDLEGVCVSLYAEIQKLVPCDAFVLALVDSSRRQLRLVFGVEEGERVPELVRPLDPQASLTAWVACERRPLLIRDAEAERAHLPASAEQIGKAVRSWLGVPLVVQDQVVGVVSVQSFAPYAYDEESERLLLTASVPVAAALHNAWSYTQLADLERKLRAVEDVSRRMQLAPTKETLYAVVLEMARSVLGHERCAILEPDGEELVVAASHDAVSWARGLRVPLRGKGLTVAAVQAQEPVYVPDVSGDERYVRGNPDTRCELAVPLVVGDQVFGVLDVQADEVDGISAQDRDLLAIVASELAVALAGLDRRARLDVLSKKLARLHDVSRQLTRCASEEEIARSAVRAMVEVLGFEHVVIGLGRGDVLVPVAWTGSLLERRQTFRKGEGVAGKTWLTGESAWGNLDRLVEARPVDPRIQSVISVPIGSVGVIQVVSGRRDAFSLEDVNLVEILARHVFEEVRRAQLEAELRDQAIRDPLTGLYNRRFLGEVLAREIERAKRYSHPLTLIMADVDDFKAVNDRYGHVVGDTALRCVASALQTNVRAGDFVFRYGGEEFVIVLPETGNGGGDAHRRLEEKVAVIPVPDVPGLAVSVSLGHVVWDPSRDGATTLEGLLRQADEALYAIKRRRGGR